MHILFYKEYTKKKERREESKLYEFWQPATEKENE